MDPLDLLRLLQMPSRSTLLKKLSTLDGSPGVNSLMSVFWTILYRYVAMSRRKVAFYFSIQKAYGDTSSAKFIQAQKSFLRSLAGEEKVFLRYSID